MAILAAASATAFGAALAGAATEDLTYEGCITGDTHSGPTPGSRACTAIARATTSGTSSGLNLPTAMALSADGASLYVVAATDDSVARFNRNTATGDLAYRGCISGDSSSGPSGSGACAVIPSASVGGTNSGLDDPRSVALSADGASLYVSSGNDDAVARFVRDTTTGALTYKGCITGETESGPAGSGACTAIPSAASGGANSGLDTPRELTVREGGGSVYLAAFVDDSVARFARNTGSGALTYRGCITGETESGPAGSGACTAIPSATSGGADSGLDVDTSLALSGDDNQLYVGSQADDAISRFNLRATGALAYVSCITGESGTGPAGSGACSAIPTAAVSGANSGLDLPLSIALSGDGASLYVAAANDDAVARFARNPSNGALAYKSCLSGKTETGSSGTGACALIPTATSGGVSSGVDLPESVAPSASGASVYLSSGSDDAVARFRRGTTSGALTFRNCITGETETGPAGSAACAAIPSAASSGTASGLDFLGQLALSGDGKSLYVGAANDDSVATFSLAP